MSDKFMVMVEALRQTLIEHDAQFVARAIMEMSPKDRELVFACARDDWYDHYEERMLILCSVGPEQPPLAATSAEVRVRGRDDTYSIGVGNDGLFYVSSAKLMLGLPRAANSMSFKQE